MNMFILIALPLLGLALLIVAGGALALPALPLFFRALLTFGMFG